MEEECGGESACPPVTVEPCLTLDPSHLTKHMHPPVYGPQDADIVVVEFAMNDGTNVDCSRDGSGTVPARASFERLLRKLQALPNRPAVIVLNSYSFIRGAMGSYLKASAAAGGGPAGGAGWWQEIWRQGRPADAARIPLPLSPPSVKHWHAALAFVQNAENEMAIIAAYYGLPTLSVRAATFHHMLRNENGYRVSKGGGGAGLGARWNCTVCTAAACRCTTAAPAAAAAAAAASVSTVAGAAHPAVCTICFSLVRSPPLHCLAWQMPLQQVDRVRTENLGESQPDELFLFDISHPYGPTGHRRGNRAGAGRDRADESGGGGGGG